MAATTTNTGKVSCTACVSLQFNMPFLEVMKMSITKDYGRLPNVLCASSTITSRYSNLMHTVSQLRLKGCNQERKISVLMRRCDDNSRLLLLMQEEDVPGLKRLALVHFRNNYSLSSFIDKCIRAAENKMVGHSTYKRKFVQRGTIRNGALDAETLNILLMTTLTNKLGCNKLLHTFNFAYGGLSHRQMQHHVKDMGTVPNFK